MRPPNRWLPPRSADLSHLIRRTPLQIRFAVVVFSLKTQKFDAYPIEQGFPVLFLILLAGASAPTVPRRFWSGWCFGGSRRQSTNHTKILLRSAAGAEELELESPDKSPPPLVILPVILYSNHKHEKFPHYRPTMKWQSDF